MLGDLGNGEFLCGLDLDSSLNEEGVLAEWAKPFLQVLNSYSEVSPSGRGLKVWFRCKADGAATARSWFGFAEGKWGTKRTLGENGANHGPAVEVNLSHRFFTVTGDQWRDGPDAIALVTRAQLGRLAELLPAARGINWLASKTPLPERDEEIDAFAVQAKVDHARRSHPGLNARWLGGKESRSDTSRSGFDMSLGAILNRGPAFTMPKTRAPP